jgi:hypothetical protein
VRRGNARARGLALLVLLSFSVCACTHGSDLPRPLVLESRTIGFSRAEPATTVRGKLRFRGGLELFSDDRDFGGLSALLVSNDGASFLAVTDQSHWVTGTLAYEDGNLASARGETIAPMLDLQGRPLSDKTGDAEGLASGRDGDINRDILHDILHDIFDDVLVSFEGEHRVWRYPFGKDGVLAVPEGIALPPEALRASRNTGLEGITRVGDGLLFAVTEHLRDRKGDYRAWILPFVPKASLQPTPPNPGELTMPPDVPLPRAVTVRPVPPYAMTDVRQLPGGDLLTLERRYNPVDGVGVQMRRIPAASLRNAVEAGPSAPLEGSVLVELDGDFEIDNMEGLSIRRGARGEILLYVVSDDNFNTPLQRTLLVMFELLP